MTTSLTQVLSLEDSPAWEYVDGVAIQKPMPKTRHFILQKRPLAEVDNKTADCTALATPANHSPREIWWEPRASEEIGAESG